MPQAQTKHFASIDYDDGAILTFPAGLPAFEHLTRFLLIEHPTVAPLIFLQSLEEQDVCLPALPILTVDADYELSLTGEDLEVLGFTSQDRVAGENTLGCFAIVSIPATGNVTANLAAPVVVNLKARLAAQAVRPDTRYSHQHPVSENTEAICS
jgi:flagellar assembly factor FliW